MATAIQNLQTSQPETKLILDKEAWMEEWAKIRGCKTIGHWLALLVESERAAHESYERNWFRGGNEVPPEGDVHIEPNHRMGPPKALTNDEEDEMWDLFKDGEEPPALARRFGIGLSTAKRILQERKGREVLR